VAERVRDVDQRRLPDPGGHLTTFGLERSARLDEMYASSRRPLPDQAAAKDPYAELLTERPVEL
jgi:hypothetical protein